MQIARLSPPGLGFRTSSLGEGLLLRVTVGDATSTHYRFLLSEVTSV